MDNKIAGLIGAMTALVAADPSQAAMSPPQNLDAAMRVQSYADLLTPIPNAAALLKLSNATVLAPAVEGDATVQDAQYYYHHHHHNDFRQYRPSYGGPYFHHHHHGYYRQFYPRHHHHHFRDYGY